MKKIYVFLFILFFIPGVVKAANTKSVKFSKCVDGDTADFIMDKEVIKVRFLAIDTPETKHPTKGTQPFGKEASEYTCNRLKNAKKIKLEFDNNSDKQDKYDRYLAWIFVDDSLLQKELIKKGYAKVDYLYGKYKYTEELKEEENKAKEKEIGIWGNDNFDFSKFIETLDIKYKIIFGIFILIGYIIFLCFNKKERKKVMKKAIKKLKN